MPTLLLSEESVDIDQYPEVQDMVGYTNFTIGDLHGNAIKFLHILVRESILSINKENYKRLVEIYKTPVDDLTHEILTEFSEIVSKMKCEKRHKNFILRLIGDELCDRGMNDYFTLVLFYQLHKEKINYEILISNHGIGFVETYEKKGLFNYPLLGEDYATSIYNLQKIIDRKLVSRNQVESLVETAYLTHLKAISYSLHPERHKITIYSHAPIDIDFIKSLAGLLNVKFSDDTLEQLVQTIDEINLVFDIYISNKNLHELYDNNSLGQFENDKKSEINPINAITWNRNYTFLNREKKYKAYQVCYVHGHDMNDPVHTISSVFNLDNLLGKSKSHHVGKYEILVSKEFLSLLKLNEYRQKIETNKAKKLEIRDAPEESDNTSKSASSAPTKSKLIKRVVEHTRITEIYADNEVIQNTQISFQTDSIEGNNCRKKIEVKNEMQIYQDGKETKKTEDYKCMEENVSAEKAYEKTGEEIEQFKATTNPYRFNFFNNSIPDKKYESASSSMAPAR